MMAKPDPTHSCVHVKLSTTTGKGVSATWNRKAYSLIRRRASILS